ncbi:UPF0481-like protein [Cinnamomum micranthum f. kanehirae]|uniref:UPF0481-like protein n=1 Tax=Cinnamomum micranthum f. kanehirae TaxID=337451 RepID=A0A443Q1T7_9MAGN|nr:UPF0481-like protein [Cinnamomum micranthum f. kanehirae]
MEEDNINAWKDSITAHVKRQDSSTVTIYKVPERLRRGKEDAFEPRIVSFGPYHHGKPNLQAMEKYKWSFLEVILSFRPQIPWERYIEAIKEEEAKIRTCYTDNFDIDSEEFVEMMLIDGCFLVGYLLQFYYDVPGLLELESMVGMHGLIRYDILLLENQLPFFILIKIFELLELTPLSFMDLAINYLNFWEGEMKVDFHPPESVHHLLHLYHSHCLYTPQFGEGSLVSTHGEEPDPINQPPSATVLPAAVSVTISEEESGPIHRPQPPSATVLHEAGVKFEKKKVKGSSSLDVTFDNGKMMIPPLVIDTFNKSRLRNLVAFEQFYPNFNELDKSFTAYVEFMDFIVNTPEDVALLHKEGIICHFLGSDQNAADFLNDLNKGVYVKSGHYLAPLYNAVYDYQQKRINKWQAILHRGLNLIDELGKEKGLSCLFLILELVISRCIVSMKKWV